MSNKNGGGGDSGGGCSSFICYTLKFIQFYPLGWNSNRAWVQPTHNNLQPVYVNIIVAPWLNTCPFHNVDVKKIYLVQTSKIIQNLIS